MKLYGTVVGTTGVSEVTIEGEQIVSLCPASSASAPSNLVIAPGFIDIQINGYGGLSFGTPEVTPEALDYVVRAQRRIGVLFICPTVCTTSHENTIHALRMLSEARRDPAGARGALLPPGRPVHRQGRWPARRASAATCASARLG
ncbi:MAG TPA: hypothetical protein PLH36_10320 [Armatimonadota bacterium]|nr:hypothetical protein [Armatimonadota bacterium]